MMMPDSGVPDSVIGNSSDIAEIGPMPGSTPTSVPMKTPMKQYSRLTGKSAMEKPCMTLTRVSIASADLENAGGQLDQQHVLEYPPRTERGEHGNRQCQGPAHRIDPAQQQQHQRDRGEQEAERLQRQRKCDQAGNHDQRSGPARTLPAGGETGPALGDRS